MAQVLLDSVTKKFGDFTAVNAMSMSVRDAEFVAILGPSGCGKTTTMNMIAGIEHPTSGSISFDAQNVTDMPVQKRGVGFVFQNYAIFTHMTVRQNLAFGLKVAGSRQSEIDTKVDSMAAFMALTHRLEQPSSSLSVNELQKLAIGRSAIVEPQIFLLDEPLSNLDAAFRERMRSDLRDLQRNLRQTMVYVTHDQIEAMSLADRIAVMNKGRLQQFDTPANIYSKPANVFVARFIGAPSMNIVRGRLHHASNQTDFHMEDMAVASIPLTDDQARVCQETGTTEALFGFRPEFVQLADASDASAFPAEVSLVETVGRRKIVHFTSGMVDFVGTFDRATPIQAGEAVRIRLSNEKCHIFDPNTEICLTRNLGGSNG